MQKGTLSLPDGTPNLECVYRCLIDVAAGMDYLHSLGVINGDLKPANILLKSTDADPRGFSCKVQLLDVWLSPCREALDGSACACDQSQCCFGML